MKVFVPLNIAGHAYLDLLYSNLEYIGINIYGLCEIRDLNNLLKADIIHLHWIENFIRTPGSFLSTILRFTFWIVLFTSSKYLLKKKIIITLHNIEPHEKTYPQLEKFGFKSYLDIADSVIVHNEWSKKEISRKYGGTEKKTYVIPHGNFIGYYPNQISKKEARDKLGIPQDVFTLLYFGKIRRYKGLDLLLEVLEDLKKEEVWIIICGKPEDQEIKDKLQKFIGKYPQCSLNLNYISDNEIQIYMNACDVGVLPYQKITTSGSLFLFGSFKRTIIVPNAESIEEVVGDYAIYYKADSKNNLEKAIFEAKNGRLAQKNESMYKQMLKLGWDDIAEKTAKIYKNVINSKPE
jgi:glycosyltransferase involved in cell wall biosynthesis